MSTVLWRSGDRTTALFIERDFREQLEGFANSRSRPGGLGEASWARADPEDRKQLNFEGATVVAS